MKKIALPILLSLLINTVIAQIDLGIQFAPSISANRITNDIDGFTLESGTSNLSFVAGPIVDLYLTDNIAFSSGLLYANKKSKLIFGDDNAIDYSLQYLQVPVTIKMFTNNITNDMRLYFQLGGTLDFKITEKGLNEEAKEFRKNVTFGKLYDAGLLLAGGVEYNIGTSNKVYAGLSYNRGLVNVFTKDTKSEIKVAAKASTDTPDDEIESSKMSFKNDIFSLVLGFKF